MLRRGFEAWPFLPMIYLPAGTNTKFLSACAIEVKDAQRRKSETILLFPACIIKIHRTFDDQVFIPLGKIEVCIIAGFITV